MVTKVTLGDIYRMTQQISIVSGCLPKECDKNTKFAISMSDWDSAERLGLGIWVSIVDIEKICVDKGIRSPFKLDWVSVL